MAYNSPKDEEKDDAKDFVEVSSVRTFDTDMAAYKEKQGIGTLGDSPTNVPNASKEEAVREPRATTKKDILDEISGSTHKDPAATNMEDVQTIEGLTARITHINKELDDLKSKVGFINENKKRLLGEKEDSMNQKESIKKALTPIQEQEKVINDEIASIKRREGEADSERKREVEKQRWEAEDKRKLLEEKKWIQEEELEKVDRIVKERSNEYTKMIDEQEKTKKIIDERESEKRQKELKIDLLKVRREKNEIEEKLTNVEVRLKDSETDLKDIVRRETATQDKLQVIDDEEKKASGIDEEKRLEKERWELESELRKIEQGRWESEDRKKALNDLKNETGAELKSILSKEKGMVDELSGLS